MLGEEFLRTKAALLRTFFFFMCSSQVSIIQYAVDPDFEFRLNDYTSKEKLITAASNINQKLGDQTNTFRAIDFAR